MQNVHVMPPEVRADYEQARAHAHGDDAFRLRFERFFTELRDPLHGVYGHDERFPEQFKALLEAMSRAAAGRDPQLRRLDHEREITPDWLQREQAVGYVTYVDLRRNTLGAARATPLSARARRGLSALLPLLWTRPRSPRRRWPSRRKRSSHRASSSATSV